MKDAYLDQLLEKVKAANEETALAVQRSQTLIQESEVFIARYEKATKRLREQIKGYRPKLGHSQKISHHP